MPHVVIHCFKADIPPDNLTRIQKALTALLQKELSCVSSAVSIDLEQVEPSLWSEQVYQPMIKPRLACLLLSPGYII